jgi:cobalt-zinc-cadmium efflux system outer membrane protein
MTFLSLPGSYPMGGRRESRPRKRSESPSGPIALAVLALLAAPVLAGAQAPAPRTPDPAGVLRLPDALSAALEGSPELASFSWELRSGEAREIQAALRPNPVLSLEVEDVGGREGLRGFSGSQTTLQLAQIIELGGKRGARIRTARLDREVVGSDYEAVRLDVLAATTQGFVDVLAAQESVRLAEEGTALAAELRDAAERRLRAGIAPRVEAARASVAESNAEMELERARRALEAARQALAASWGAEEARFERGEGDLERVGSPPSLASLRGSLDANPDLARWQGERARRRAALDLARAQAAPDVEIGPGVRYLAGEDSTAFLLGASLPLPFFHRNQGAVAEAGSRLAQASDEERAARVRAFRELAREYQALAAARARALSYRSEILPTSRAALDQVRGGYLEGRFSQLDVIDAQRTLFTARAEYVEALATYHRSAAAIERLTAAPLPLAP